MLIWQLTASLVPAERRPLPAGVDLIDYGTDRHLEYDFVVGADVGQRVVLVCTIWSTHNRIPIEARLGEISEVGSTIMVEWQLPYYREPLWDRLPPDDYLDYFEEELEMNSFTL